MSSAVHNADAPPWWRRLLWHHELDDLGRWRHGTWMGTYSGGKFWPLDPRADEIFYDDLVMGLARECRYGRQCREFYSVAEHCVIVSLFAEKIARERGWTPEECLTVARAGLLHDSAEAWIGDMIRPIKHQPVMKGFRKAEHRIEKAVFIWADLRPTQEVMDLVKEVDNRVLVDEIEALMYDPSLYLKRHAPVSGLGAEIAALPWERAAEVFSQRFEELWPETP